MIENKNTQQHESAAIFGEVLFDCFPDGSNVLGGAPFNVAWHLQGLGLAPLFISRVGADDLGRQIAGRMREWGMDTAGLQQDADHPTGRVQVSLPGGQPSYEIVPGQAYDFIDRTQALAALKGRTAALLYFGTLITRNPASRSALEALRDRSGLPCFVDLNLRAPWWNEDMLQQALSSAHWLKLNDEELALVSGRRLPDRPALAEAARELIERHGIALVIVTRGARGALAVGAHHELEAPAATVTNLTDTVGAGDAFSAVTILGLLQGWPLDATLQRAGAFAASVCALRGATTTDHDFYHRHLEQWNITEGAS